MGSDPIRSASAYKKHSAPYKKQPRFCGAGLLILRYRRTMLCISSIVFLVVLALHVVTAARCTLGSGYFERVFALLYVILLCSPVRGNSGMYAPCQTLDLSRFM